MPVVSKKLSIKAGCIRSVHIYPNGSARWVVKHDGKLVCVSGTVDKTVFIPNSKYQHIVDGYIPSRVNRKENNTKINIHKPDRVIGDCFYQGEKRRVAYHSNRITGTISWKNKTVKVKVVNQIASEV